MSSFFSSSTQNKNVINKETEALAAAATAAAAEESQVCEFEQTLLSVSECFVYKVPTLRSASGHRAEDWSLAAPLFTGNEVTPYHFLYYRCLSYLLSLSYSYLNSTARIIQERLGCIKVT